MILQFHKQYTLEDIEKATCPMCGALLNNTYSVCLDCKAAGCGYRSDLQKVNLEPTEQKKMYVVSRIFYCIDKLSRVIFRSNGRVSYEKNFLINEQIEIGNMALKEFVWYAQKFLMLS